MSKTYAELTNEIRELEGQAREAFTREKAATIVEIKARLKELRLTPQQLFSQAKIKYRDPETGETWSGHGRAPGWLKDKDRSKYAVF